MEYAEPIAKVLSLALGFYLIWKAAFRLRGILSGEDVHLDRDGEFANNYNPNGHCVPDECKVPVYRVHRIVYPKGDRSRLSVAWVWPWDADHYDMASSQPFADRDEAQEHAQTLAAKYDLTLDEDSPPQRCSIEKRNTGDCNDRFYPQWRV